MKKISLFCIGCLFSILLQAQSEHLKFMGIPLDGKISAFHKEMKKKGFSLDEIEGRKLHGIYIYNGVFAGEKSQVFVYYDDKTKIVYRAGVIITCYSKETVINKYENSRDMLEEKYSEDEGVLYAEKIKKDSLANEIMMKLGGASFEWKVVDEEEGYEATTFLIPNIDSGLRGEIRVYVRELFSNITNSIIYNLHILYTDCENDHSIEEIILDDF